VESGTLRQVVKSPSHPYTRGLLSSTLHGARRGQRLEAIPGAPPRLDQRPVGCGFAPRCSQFSSQCSIESIPLVGVSRGHEVRCVKAETVASH
jgi:peptide/nickel transport system ATP-binding protein